MSRTVEIDNLYGGSWRYRQNNRIYKFISAFTVTVVFKYIKDIK